MKEVINERHRFASTAVSRAALQLLLNVQTVAQL